jgi:hypothetical protein
LQRLVSRSTFDHLAAGPNEHFLDQLDGRRIVVHHHDSRSGQRGAFERRTVLVGDRLLALLGAHERQRNHERRALPLPRALGVDAAAVELREMPDQCQADPEAAVATGASALALS